MQEYPSVYVPPKDGLWYKALVKEKGNNRREKAVFVYASPSQDAYFKYCTRAPAYRFKLLSFNPLTRKQTKKVNSHIFNAGGENLLNRTRKYFYIVDNPSEIQLW